MTLTFSLQEKLRAYVKARSDVNKDGCWIWNKSTGSHGYGNGSMPAAMNGQRVSVAHRMSYVAFKGEIPEGYDVDHLCKVRRCVNPAHLEATTRLANRRRQNGHDCPADTKHSDGCPHGHRAYYHNGDQWRCAKCEQGWKSAYNAKRYAAE